MNHIIFPAVLFVSSLLPLSALTEAELAPDALTGKTLTFTVETGAAPLATIGSFTGTFGEAPGNVFTKTLVTGDSTNANGTWAFNGAFSGMYEYTIVHFLPGRPDGILTLWISDGVGRYEVFLSGMFGVSQTGGFSIAPPPVGQSPEISVQQPKGKELSDGRSMKKFGSVEIGKASGAKIFTIKNTGTSKLTGLALTKSGANARDFTVTALGKTSLAPGASTTFKVTFKPKAKGKKDAFIKIKSNDEDENPFDIPVTGTGLK
jgi:Abnormal spindle-like microcephaly-assoc'd, ASPM-SPD-2-Hydin